MDEEDEIQAVELNESDDDDQNNPGEVLGDEGMEIPEPDIEANAPQVEEPGHQVLNPSRMEYLCFAQEFIHQVSHATLDNGRLDDLTIDIPKRAQSTFWTLTHASRLTYFYPATTLLNRLTLTFGTQF